MGWWMYASDWACKTRDYFWVRLAQELQGVGDGENISLKAEVTRLKFPRFSVCFLELNSEVRISALSSKLEFANCRFGSVADLPYFAEYVRF